jgi:hypothetical protein
MIGAIPRLRLSPQKVLLVLLISATFLFVRWIAREHLLDRLCGDAERVYEGGRCRPAPAPVIIHRDILRT